MIGSTNLSGSSYQVILDSLSYQPSSTLFKKTDTQSFLPGPMGRTPSAMVERALKNSAEKGIDLSRILLPQSSRSTSYNFPSVEEGIVNALFPQSNGFSPPDFTRAFSPSALQDLIKIWTSGNSPGQIVNRTA